LAQTGQRISGTDTDMTD